MIELTPTTSQLLTGKSKSVVIIEYITPLAVTAGDVSDVLDLALPNIRLHGLTYSPYVVSLKVKTESDNFDVSVYENNDHVSTDDVAIKVINIDTMYYENDMNVYCNSNNPSHSVKMVISNVNGTADIVNTTIRIVLEVMQYTHII